MSFTCIWNSSLNEIIPTYGEVSVTVYNFLLGWNHPYQKGRDDISWEENKKSCVKTSSGMKFYNEHVFRMYPIFFPTLTCLNIMKVTTNILQELFTWKRWSPENHYAFCKVYKKSDFFIIIVKSDIYFTLDCSIY